MGNMTKMEELLYTMEIEAKSANKGYQKLFEEIKNEESEDRKLLLLVLQQLKMVHVRLGTLASMINELRPK